MNTGYPLVIEEFIFSSRDKIISCIRKKCFQHLETYRAQDMTYLSMDGMWEKGPPGISSRISADFWHSLYNSRKHDDSSIVDAFFLPCLKNRVRREVMIRLWKIFKPANRDEFDFPALFATICRLIEHFIQENMSETYCPEWDYPAMKRKEFFRSPFVECAKSIEDSLCSTVEKKEFSGICDDLRSSDAVEWIIRTLVHEEILLGQLDEFCVTNRSLKKNYSYEDLEEIFELLGSCQAYPGSMLRICMKFLNGADFDVTSGIPYRAVNVLSELYDCRVTDTLISMLKRTDRKYPLLRSNLIYVLGKLASNDAVPFLERVLRGPDEFVNIEKGTRLSLMWEKQEALWALGKLGNLSCTARKCLRKRLQKFSKLFKISLAWALGRTGRLQQEAEGCIDADLVSFLLELIEDRDMEVFEEAVYAVRELGMNEIFHRLRLRNLPSVSVLAMKPSRTGLVEVNRTLDLLLSEKKTVVMAVTGDSGTGKTYFCESILQGFSCLERKDILYLARDDSDSAKTFNRILGIKYLRKHVSPEFYQDYLMTDVESDDPQANFFSFMETCRDKRLILLDGWQDTAYFDQVIKTFHGYGCLDILIRFRTNLSTRRLNLENREKILERVESCMACLEEGMTRHSSLFSDVAIYHLDNSINYRLDREEILSAFMGPHVPDWGINIRLGEFSSPLSPMRVRTRIVTPVRAVIKKENAEPIVFREKRFVLHEATFHRIQNNDLGHSPCLLQEIRCPGLKFSRIIHYSIGQVAFSTVDGKVGIISGYNDKIHFLSFDRKKVEALCVLPDMIGALDINGRLLLISFAGGMLREAVHDFPRFTCIASDREKNFVVGDTEGCVHRIDPVRDTHSYCRAHSGKVTGVAVDSRGNITSTGNDGMIFHQERESSRLLLDEEIQGHKRIMQSYCRDSVAVMSDTKLYIVCGTEVREITLESGAGMFESACFYPDGRIAAGLIECQSGQGTLMVIRASGSQFLNHLLPGHKEGTTGCLSMGPKIITCGTQDKADHSIRIWGTEAYIVKEHEKMGLISKMKNRPSFWHSQF